MIALLLMAAQVGAPASAAGASVTPDSVAAAPASSPEVPSPGGDRSAVEPPPRPRARVPHAQGDPLEGFNRSMFTLHNKLDRGIFRPAAMGYKHVVPGFVRSAVRHFFSNLTEPVVFANYVLQLKIGKAAETAARFTINSTAGLGGTIDVARRKGINLPHRPNGLGNTLGYYGVKPGPYLFLPFVGPSNFRDLLGGTGDGLLLPTVVGSPFDRTDYQVGKAVVTGLDLRAERDADLRALLDSALDPYATLRSVYLQDRAGEIAGLHGQSADGAGADAAGGELADPLTDPGEPAPSGAAELQDPLADPAAPDDAIPESAAPLPGGPTEPPPAP